MAEHVGRFLWNGSPAANRNPGDDYALDPEVLGVSAELTGRLADWNDRYPLDSTPSPGWVREGRALARQLQREFDARDLSVLVLFHEDGHHRERPASHGD